MIPPDIAFVKPNVMHLAQAVKWRAPIAVGWRAAPSRDWKVLLARGYRKPLLDRNHRQAQSSSRPSEYCNAQRCENEDLSSRATEQELIQFVRAEAGDVDSPNLLRRQSGPPKASTFVLQEPLDLESRSWTIGMGWWPDPTPASHHPLVKPNAIGLKLRAQGTHNATR